MKISGMVLCGLAIISCSFLFPNVAKAKPFKASLALLPIAAQSRDEGMMVELIKLWEKNIHQRITIQVYPFKRSIRTVIDRKADFHLPLIKSPYQHHSTQDFDYSSSSIFSVNFVLYSNKNNPVDADKLTDHVIYTDASHSNLFNFKILSDYSVESSFKKLARGRIDGYIFADVEADPVLKKLGYSHIKRQLYKVYQVHAVLPKGASGNSTDKMITKAMSIIKQNGQWAKLMNPVYHQYIDWQP